HGPVGWGAARARFFLPLVAGPRTSTAGGDHPKRVRQIAVRADEPLVRRRVEGGLERCRVDAEHRTHLRVHGVPRGVASGNQRAEQVAEQDLHRAGGRRSYGVLSTIVVVVETFARARITASRCSSAPGEATLT